MEINLHFHASIVSYVNLHFYNFSLVNTITAIFIEYLPNLVSIDIYSMNSVKRCL